MKTTSASWLLTDTNKVSNKKGLWASLYDRQNMLSFQEL